MTRRIKKFDFNRTDWNNIELQLASTDWFVLFDGLSMDECVAKFDEILKVSFDLFVPTFLKTDSAIRFPWFDRELRNLENKKTKAQKYFKNHHIQLPRPLTIENQNNYDAALLRFRNLRAEFN
jgi:hypothetical protein